MHYLCMIIHMHRVCEIVGLPADLLNTRSRLATRPVVPGRVAIIIIASCLIAIYTMLREPGKHGQQSTAGRPATNSRVPAHRGTVHCCNGCSSSRCCHHAQAAETPPAAVHLSCTSSAGPLLLGPIHPPPRPHRNGKCTCSSTVTYVPDRWDLV